MAKKIPTHPTNKVTTPPTKKKTTQPPADTTAQDELDHQQALKYGKDLARVYVAEKAKREKLELANQVLNAIFASSPDGLMVLNDEFVIVRINPTIARWFEVAPESAINRAISDVVPIESLAAELQQLASDERMQAEVEFIVTEPILRFIHTDIVRMKTAHKSGWILVFHDQSRHFGAKSILKERYRIEGLLGKGGMGAVYLAYDQALQIQVAVKENLNFDLESERQFRNEAELLAGLRHPNLPRVIDYFIVERRQYLVMDYIEGEDLYTRAQQSPPSIYEVLAWTDTLCNALIYLHTRQPPVIHRDIKPANVKLQPDGTIALVDFGMAKKVDRAHTTIGVRGFTPGFSPPEQYSAEPTDTRSDQFSLAATIYTLLTGQLPADSINRMANIQALKSVRSLNPDVPKHVDASLNRALALDPDDRFPDVKSFRNALRG